MGVVHTTLWRTRKVVTMKLEVGLILALLSV
jgi:hypothetical protein